MRILFSVPAYKPAYRFGGPILSVSALAEGLVRRGHEVTVFTTNSNLDEDLDILTDQPMTVDGVEVWYFRHRDPLHNLFGRIPYLSKSGGFLYAPCMRSALDARVPGVDIVHTHLPFGYPTYAASRAALRHRKPLFYHQRGVFDPARLRFRRIKKKVFLELFEKPVMRRATCLIALTAAEVSSYRALGIDTATTVIPNGIDTHAYRNRPRARASDGLDIPPQAVVILFMGRIHPIKGADTLLEAFLKIAASHPLAWLVVAGPDEWGAEHKMRARAVEAGIADRIVFTGMIEGEGKKDLLARADLFCLPSAGEGFSMAILEALASETAVLISPGCNFPEVVDAGAGRVVANDAADLSRAIASMISDLPNLRAMGVKGRAFVLGHYSWERIVDKTEAAYLSALDGVPNARP
jgi:glycosyltransferase involved in cell wall biosynthesis